MVAAAEVLIASTTGPFAHAPASGRAGEAGATGTAGWSAAGDGDRSLDGEEVRGSADAAADLAGDRCGVPLTACPDMSTDAADRARAPPGEDGDPGVEEGAAPDGGGLVATSDDQDPLGPHEGLLPTTAACEPTGECSPAGESFAFSASVF